MDKQQAQNIIKETFENPFDRERFTGFVKNLLNSIDENKAFHARGDVKEMFRHIIKTYERIGTYIDPNGKKIDIIITYLQKGYSLDHARVTQRNFAGRYLADRGEKDAGLFAFVSPDENDWRFSLVTMDYEIVQTKSGNWKGQEKFSQARRWSFLVGKNESSHTAQSRLVPILTDDKHDPTLARLEEAFNIEKVTKEFFEKYRDLFLRTKEELDKVVENDSKVRYDFEQKGVDTVNFAKKLLGQIVFLYFLQKKGWFGVERDAKWGTGTKQFLRELFSRRDEFPKGGYGKQTNFFNDILEPLFYEALRRPRDDDYYSHFNCKIPFLNGGLFDPINNYDWVHTDILLPNELFSNRTKTKEGDIGDGILDIFDRYNFTVKEDEPLEKEVAVDPEMLGKVFENLLEVKDRKSKGTYYTPREIVHYMCQQSLINYLYTELNKSETSYQKIGDIQTDVFGNKVKTGQFDLIAEHKSSPQISKEDLETLVKYGEQVGENEATVKAKGRETDTYSYKLPESIRKNAKLIDDKLASIKVCDPAIGSGAFPVGMMHEIVKTRNVLTTFLNPPSIPPLSRGDTGGLRTIYHFKRRCIENSLYGVDIDPGAVEIAKLRLWLSLVVDEEDIKQIKPLPNLDYKIVCGNSLLGVGKNLFNNQLFAELERLKPLYFDETNPTKKQEYKQQIDELISRITDGHKEFDFEVYFSEVFHEKQGFDVVIANPPYVRQEKIRDQKPLLQKQGYEVYNSTSDLYTYFYERSHQILKPNGFSCFISSNKWMRGKYGENLRRFFKEKTTLKQIIDFNGYKVFDATVDTDILLFQKTFPVRDTQTVKPSLSAEQAGGNIVHILNIKPDFTPSTDITTYFNSHKLKIKQSELDSNCFTFADETTMNLKKKLEEKGIPLKNWDVKICFGIKTGFSEAFIITTEKRDEILANCKTEEERKMTEQIIKPILRGRDIYRYGYKWAGLWLINSHNGLRSIGIERINVEKDYPVIYKHLQQYQENLETRQDKGDHWTNLRNCAYLDEFEKEKISYQEISYKSSFSWDNNKMFVNQSCYIISNTNKYVLSLLNSKLINDYFRLISQTLGTGAFRWIKQYVEQIPIPKISLTKQEPFIELVDCILAITKDSDYLDNPLKQAKVKEYEQQIDEMVYILYELSPEEIKIVEGENENAD